MERVVDFKNGERVVIRAPLAKIRVAHNPRCPVPSLSANLAEEGYEGLSFLELVHQLALSEDAAKRAEFVRLFDKYESDKGEDAHTVVSLANSRRRFEIEPILLRDFRSKDRETGEYETYYGIVAGERRVLAAAYNFAKYGDAADIGAVVKKLTVDEAYELAIEENLKRREMTDLEVGYIIRHYREKTNPTTSKRFNLREIAEKLGEDYQFIRNREALTYLSDGDKKRLAEGRLGLVRAFEIGLASKKGKAVEDAPDKKENRSRVMTLKEVQELFDSTKRDQVERLTVLAEVMRMSLSEALAASDKREEEEELRASREVERRLRKERDAA